MILVFCFFVFISGSAIGVTYLTFRVTLKKLGKKINKKNNPPGCSLIGKKKAFYIYRLLEFLIELPRVGRSQ